MRQAIRLGATVALLAAMVLVVAGCKNSAQNGALIGAGAGALGGYIIGNEVDK